jgi:hypothetical protein
MLVDNLSRVVDLWIVREFWHILNNLEIFLQTPELLTSEMLFSTDIQRSLHQWQTFHLQQALSRSKFYWLGDSLRESFLSPACSLELFSHWEALATALDQYLDQHIVSANAVFQKAAFRDLTALAASLPSAFVLTHREVGSSEPPWLCRIAEIWGLNYAVELEDPIVDRERNFLLQLLTEAGMAKLLWGELDLVIAHLVFATAFPPPTLLHDRPVLSHAEANLWKTASFFWYPLEISTPSHPRHKS